MASDPYNDEKIVARDYNSFGAKKKGKSLLSTLNTAVGNFSVQYNFQAISIALIVMAASVCTYTDDECKEGEQKPWVTSTATATVFIGAITGQLTMGYAGDVLGRNNAMTLTLAIASISALLSAVTPQGSPSNIYVAIIICRFMLGIGVGGVYPLSAIKAAEDGGKADGGVDIYAAAFAFFWQVPGSMTPWLLALIFSYEGDNMSTDMKWRLLLGLGSIPAAFVVMCSIIETVQKARQDAEDDMSSHALLNHSYGHTEKFLHDTDGDILSTHSSQSSLSGSHSAGKNSGGKSGGNNTNNPLLRGSLSNLENGHHHSAHNGTEQSSGKSVSDYLKLRSTWIDLLVTGGGWFIYDVAYYGVNLFGGEILNKINSTDDDNVSADSSVRQVAMQQLIALGMGIPACLCAILALRYIGTKRLQVYGFLFIAFCFVLLACLFAPLAHGKHKNPDALFAVYCLLLFSLSWGPNLTTYLLPAETYPKEVRATFNGISAACGKLGAFTGVYVFGPMADATSYATVMLFCAIISVIGAIITQVFTRDKPTGEAKLALFDNGEGNDNDDNDSIVQ